MKDKYKIKEIYNFVDSLDNTEPKELYSVFPKLRNNQAINRLILLLQHVLMTDGLIRKIQKTHRILNDEADKYVKHHFSVDEEHINMEVIDKIKFGKNEERVDKISNIQNDYTLKLLNEIDSVSRILINTKGLFNTSLQIKNSASIINDDIFIISPIFYSIKRWKLLVNYELEIINDKSIIKPTIDKFIYFLNDLKYRLNTNKIPRILYFNNGYKEQEMEIDSNIWGFNKTNFKYSIDDYIFFLKNIDTNNISNNSNIRLLKSFKKEEELRKSILRKQKKSKLTLLVPKKIKKVYKGLLFLLKKTNPAIDNSILNKISIRIISCIIHTPSKYNIDFVIPNYIILDKHLIIDYMLFLEKNNYFDDSNVSIANILFENIPIKLKGFSTKNIFRLMKEKRLNNLLFKGLTSEIALKNEMKY